MGALDEAQKRNKKFSIVGLNIGPTFGPSRTGDFTVNGRAQFFSPFGGDGTHAVQAQGEYMYYPGHQEGQFDIGLVNRWGNVQAGAFASFKYINFKGDQSGGGLGQAAFLLDYLFSDGRIGIFGTQGFKSIAVLNSTTIAPGVVPADLRAGSQPIRHQLPVRCLGRRYDSGQCRVLTAPDFG